MKTVNIIIPFTLTLNDASRMDFDVGEHEVEDEIAAHPWLIAHSDQAPYIEPLPGTPEGAAVAARRVQRRRMLDTQTEEDTDNARQTMTRRDV